MKCDCWRKPPSRLPFRGKGSDTRPKYFMVYRLDEINSIRTHLRYLSCVLCRRRTRLGKERRRRSPAVTDNPPSMTMSSRYNTVNRATVITVLSYPSKSDAPIITTSKLTDIDAFELSAKIHAFFSTQTTRHVMRKGTCSRYVRWMHFTVSSI